MYVVVRPATSLALPLVPALAGCITGSPACDMGPAWSPDGRFLVWARHGELVVARTDGSGRVDIGPGNFPSWVR